MTYLLPTTIESALESLVSGQQTIVAGATDYYPSLGGADTTADVLDITRLSELDLIQDEGQRWRIGALATWSDLASANLPPALAGLAQAATEIGSVQIQNVGTLVGNLCNASPAADGVPPLLTLDANVELRSTDRTRIVPLDRFILGNRSTAMEPNEMVTAVLIDHPQPRATGSFVKLGARSYLAISIVMVAAVTEVGSDGIIGSARIAVGACSEVAKRLPDLEADLVGVSLADLGDGSMIRPHHLAPLSPIDDVRASAAYRMSVTPRLIARALVGCQDAGR